VSRKPFDFDKAKRRSKFEAWVLDSTAAQIHKQHGAAKAEAIGGLTGTVVELGPGTGANMRYYAPGVKVIAIEPNPGMHAKLRASAAEHGVDLEIRTLRGEQIDVGDHEADAVVGTLVLCGVDDPRQVVSEVLRVLKPGGTYFFLEHVVAPEGTITRRVQKVVKRPHRWAFNGCEVDRDTAALLEGAGFSAIAIEAVDVGLAGGMYCPNHIIGTATR
jgi:ubiquinone/menaquinone biosynthesis C-methylase UbiE